MENFLKFSTGRLRWHYVLINLFSLSAVLWLSFLPLQSFALEKEWTGSGCYDVGWFHPDSTIYHIDSASKLAGFAYLVNNGEFFKGKKVELTSDIDLAGKNWIPIGGMFGCAGDDCVPKCYFAGTFDGNGHTVYNMNINYVDKEKVIYASKSVYLGFFGWASSMSIIRNVNFDNAQIYYSKLPLDAEYYTEDQYTYPQQFAWIGTIAGKTRGLVEKCSCVASIQLISGTAGGIVGEGQNISECSFSGTLRGFDCHHGVGLYGIAGEAETVVDCVNRANLIFSGRGFGAGIVGSASNVWRCQNYGNMLLKESTSLIMYKIVRKKHHLAGGFSGIARHVENGISSCINYGNIRTEPLPLEPKDYYRTMGVNITATGIAETVCWPGHLTNCVNNGNIEIYCNGGPSNNAAYGITNCGYEANITNCINRGNITIRAKGSTNKAAGIAPCFGALRAGAGWKKPKPNFTNCLNMGKIVCMDGDKQLTLYHVDNIYPTVTYKPYTEVGSNSFGATFSSEDYKLDFDIEENAVTPDSLVYTLEGCVDSPTISRGVTLSAKTTPGDIIGILNNNLLKITDIIKPMYTSWEHMLCSPVFWANNVNDFLLSGKSVCIITNMESYHVDDKPFKVEIVPAGMGCIRGGDILLRFTFSKDKIYDINLKGNYFTIESILPSQYNFGCISHPLEYKKTVVNNTCHEYRIHVPNDALYINYVYINYSPSSDIDNVKQDLPFRISLSNDKLIVNTQNSIKIKVADSEGRICVDRLVNGSFTYRLPHHGVYMVKGENKIFKIVY